MPPELAFILTLALRMAVTAAFVVSAWAVRSALIRSTVSPSRVRVFSGPLSKATIDTCTAAPSRIQSRSDHAAKMPPARSIRSRTVRLSPPRIPCVAKSPARVVGLASIDRRANSNQ